MKKECSTHTCSLDDK